MDNSGRLREIDILGVPIAAVSMTEAVNLLSDRIRSGDKYLVFTPNPEMIDRSRRESSFRRLLLDAHLRVADGVGLLWASRLYGDPLPGTVPGVDLMQHLLAECARGGCGVFLLGTTEENVELAARRAQKRYSDLRVVGYHHGFFAHQEIRQVLRRIKQSEPRLVIAGMGVPKDQRFLVANFAELPPAVYLAVGGGLDVMARAVTRAPGLLRRLCLEWLYRLISSPSRWRRHLSLARFAAAVMQRRIIGG